MTTYELPELPKDRPLWSWDQNTGDPIKWAWSGALHAWVSDRGIAASEMEMWAISPLTDEDPDPSLEVLAERVVEAARRWHDGAGMRTSPSQELRAAVVAYEAKKNQP